MILTYKHVNKPISGFNQTEQILLEISLVCFIQLLGEFKASALPHTSSPDAQST